jgi:peptide/nickel transport system permease protein
MHIEVSNSVAVPETATELNTSQEVMSAGGRIRGVLLRHRLVRLLARRIALGVVLVFVVSALTFVLVSLTPGNAADDILGFTATRAQYASLTHQLGLNLPLYEQYAHWAGHALTGNLGTSVFTGQSVTQALDQRLPVTLSLMLGSLLVSVVVGVAVGVVSAVRGGIVGRGADALSLVGFSLPNFWVGAIFISLFAVRYRWFPAIGYVSFGQSPFEWLRSIVLPVAALSLGGIAAIAKQTREAMLEALGSEYVRGARANGIRRRSIVFRHALKNAAGRVVTVVGVQAVGLLGGTVLIENVFSIPGLGSLVVTGTVQHDLPVVEGTVVYFTIIVIVVNLMVDVVYSWLNPRVQVR